MPLSPRNELEILLAAVHTGEVDPEAFVARLLDLQVFMPIKDEKHQIAGFQISTQADPLIVEVDDEQKVMVLFTAPERAKAFLTQFPGSGGGLLTEFAWILRRMADDMGIALNPGEEDGFDFDAEMIAMMASLLPDEQ